MKAQENKLQQRVQQLHSETSQWISDLSFYADDLKFLNHLQERYFEEMVAHENLDEIREEVIRFENLRYSCKKLIGAIKLHQRQLSSYIQAEENETKQRFEHEHQKLDVKIKTFVLTFKKTKKEIFSIADTVLERRKENKMM